MKGERPQGTRAQHLEAAKGLPGSSQVDSLLTTYSSWSNRMKEGNSDNAVVLQIAGSPFFTYEPPVGFVEINLT